MNTPEMVTLEITRLTNGGDGLGHLDGKAVFVGGTLPGDTVRCRLTVEKKRYAKGQLVQVVQPSPQRINPECEYFSQCGGCDWQMLAYTDQCAWKQRLFSENCQHQLQVGGEIIKPILPSMQAFGYRSRVQFKCCATAGGFELGFFQRSSHRVVAVASCPVVDPRINSLLPVLRHLFAGNSYAAHVEQIDVAVGSSGQPRVVIHFTGNSVAPFCSWLAQKVMQLSFACFVQSSGGGLCHVQGAEQLVVEIGEPALGLSYAPNGFAQINLKQNCELVELVMQAVQLDAGSVDGLRVLDLYCGMGNFSLPLARHKKVKLVIGVEGYAPSIEYAQKNASAHNLTNTAFYTAPVEKFMRSFQEQVDVVVLDPPRAGAKEVVPALIALRARRLVYVSCDQQTLLRDLKVLLEANYRLVSVQPLDMFPQTAHTEILAVLDLA
jgi:23S rRNA (uracil1939-C5)-methyltransferase